MIIFPAIDLKGGQCVRLAEGDMNRATVYADDPAVQAALFRAAGATHLHVVDLDGAFAGEARNEGAVRAAIAGFGDAMVQLVAASAPPVTQTAGSVPESGAW